MIFDFRVVLVLVYMCQNVLCYQTFVRYSYYQVYIRKTQSGGAKASISDEVPPNIEEIISKDPKLQAYLKGPAGKPWTGSRELLKRKGQYPSAELSPLDVIKKCLQALQNNDEPQLDHGACVLLEFKSPIGPLAEGGLDPAGYGHFLRTTSPYDRLIDFRKVDFIGKPVELRDSLSLKQTVKVTGWNEEVGHDFDFYLSNIDGNWLVDVILSK